MTQEAELHRHAEAVRGRAMLRDEVAVGRGERVELLDLTAARGEGEQLSALGR
jgi:hypothetical protein